MVGHAAVEVLSVYLQSVEVPCTQEALQEFLRVRFGQRVHGREVVTVPPRDVLGCPLLGTQHHVGVLLQEMRRRVGSQRRPP